MRELPGFAVLSTVLAVFVTRPQSGSNRRGAHYKASARIVKRYFCCIDINTKKNWAPETDAIPDDPSPHHSSRRFHKLPFGYDNLDYLSSIIISNHLGKEIADSETKPVFLPQE